MDTKKITTLLLSLTVSIALADSSMLVEIKDVVLQDIFQPSIKKELKKCLNKDCKIKGQIPELIKKEFTSEGYVESPDDSIFSIVYTLNKAAQKNKLVSPMKSKYLSDVVDSFEFPISCTKALQLYPVETGFIGNLFFDFFMDKLKNRFPKYREGKAFYFILTQPNIEKPKQDNIYICSGIKVTGEL